MSDKRMLGARDFMERILNRLEAEELLNSRTKEVREARHVFVYLGNINLSKSLTALGVLLRINQSAASPARQKGQQVVNEKGLAKKLTKFKY